MRQCRRMPSAGWCLSCELGHGTSENQNAQKTICLNSFLVLELFMEKQTNVTRSLERWRWRDEESTFQANAHLMPGQCESCCWPKWKSKKFSTHFFPVAAELNRQHLIESSKKKRSFDPRVNVCRFADHKFQSTIPWSRETLSCCRKAPYPFGPTRTTRKQKYK